MNKEEIEDMFETLTKQWGDTDNYVNDLLSYSKNLQQENKQLKEKIDIAIEILESDDAYSMVDYVLEKLKGGSNE